MNDEELSRIALLAAADGAPDALMLNPEVRSGASFSFDPGAVGNAAWPRFKVVWFFTVAPLDRANFGTQISAYESGATMVAGGVTYMGTYGVTISGAAPDLEYRTVWGLDSLAALQNLNDQLYAATGLLRAWLHLIAPIPAMRSEIMGRIVSSAVIPGS